MAMLIEIRRRAGARSRSTACAAISASRSRPASPASLASWLGWRAAFAVPALICVATGVAYWMLVADDSHTIASRKKTAEVALNAPPPR